MPGDPTSILLIGDDRMEAALAGQALCEDALGPFRVERASGLAEGMARIAEGRVDVMILDVGLSGANGSDACRIARAAAPDVPIIAAAEPAEEASGLRAIAEGADDCVILGQTPRHMVAKAVFCACERHKARQALRDREMEYRDLFDDAPVGYHEIDTEGLITRVNQTELAMLGYRAEEMIGRRVWEFVVESEESQRSVHAKLSGNAPTGGGFDRTYRRKDGTTVAVLVDDRILTGATGGIVGIRSVLRDATDRRTAEATQRQFVSQLSRMVEITAQLSRETDMGALCRKAVELARAHFGIDRLSIFLSIHAGDRLRGMFGTDELGRARDERHRFLDTRDAAIQDVLHGKASFVVRETRTPEPGGAPFRRGWNAIVPLAGRKRVLGILSVDSLAPGPGLDEQTLQLLRLYGTSIGHLLEGLSFDKEQRMIQTELRIAHTIQQGLLPRVPLMTGIDLWGASYPAEATGGDYFDFIPMRDGSIGLVVGDASGHGLGPALIAADTCAYLRALALHHADIGAIVTAANHLLAADVGEDFFITLILAQFHPETRILRHTSAGHETGYVLNQDGAIKARLESTDMPLGVDPQTIFLPAPPVALAPGDVVCLFSDGIREAPVIHQGIYGSDRALEVIRQNRHRSAREIADAIYSAVCSFSISPKPTDDITLIILKMLPQ